MASSFEDAAVARMNSKPIPPVPPFCTGNVVKLGNQVFVRCHAETWTKDLREYEWATLVRMSRRMDLPLEFLDRVGVAE